MLEENIVDKNLKRELEMQATRIRMDVIKGTFNAKCGHPGGSLSISDIMAYLYFHKMNVDPQNPDWEDRDRFVLSKGHTAPALYGALALRGFFPEDEIERLRKPTSFLQGHPSLRMTPGVDMSTGSLGQGISAAVGMALGAKLGNKDFQVYTVLGDGEIQEGQVWEAAMFAAAKRLDNLVAVVDNNNLQIDGTLEEVNSPYPIDKKFEAFGWNVVNCDGNDFDSIDDAFTAAEQHNGKPSVIVAKTVKGKGVSYMENEVGWHGKAPNQDEYEEAMKELRDRLSALETAAAE